MLDLPGLADWRSARGATGRLGEELARRGFRVVIGKPERIRMIGRDWPSVALDLNVSVGRPGASAAGECHEYSIETVG